MSWWLLVRKSPKWVLVAGVILVSTGAFGFWWLFLHSRHSATPRSVDNSGKVEKVKSRVDSLILADDDLYEVGTGQLLFKNYLKGDSPVSLFYDAKAGKLIGQYQEGFARYALDGTKEAGLFQKGGMVLASNKQTAIYVKQKDIWQAGVDWKAFKLVNERKATSIGTFNELNFSANLLLASDKVLVVRNLNQLLRVNLETGEVKPTKITMQDLTQGRSPDGSFMVGDMHGNNGRKFFTYDVATDTAKSFEGAQTGAGGFTWLDNDRCAFIVGGKAVALFDKRKAALEEVAALPFPCNQMREPSPDGRYVFCSGRQGGALVDLQKKTALPVLGGAGVKWVSNDTFAFSRDVQDSDLRGTWLQKAGENEKRVSLEPYQVSRAGGFIMPLPSGNLAVFSTKTGLYKVNSDGGESAELTKLSGPPRNVIAVQQWKTE